MQNIQDVFNRMQDTKSEIKDLRGVIKDALDNSHEYQMILDEISVLKEKKKDIELEIRDDYSSECIKLDELNLDLKTDKELLSDIALNMVAKGEMINITDGYGKPFEPKFSVKLTKIN